MASWSDHDHAAEARAELAEFEAAYEALREREGVSPEVMRGYEIHLPRLRAEVEAES